MIPGLIGIPGVWRAPVIILPAETLPIIRLPGSNVSQI